MEGSTTDNATQKPHPDTPPQKPDPLFSLPTVWRDTLDDGYISFRHFSYDHRELRSESLKDATFDFDKNVTLNLNHFIDYPAQ
jgi:hypothetical protein